MAEAATENAGYNPSAQHFRLIRADGSVAADCFQIFAAYWVVWKAEPPTYRSWPTIQEAITDHGLDPADLHQDWSPAP